MKKTKVEEAIAEYWGERCSEHEAECPVCQAWQEYDQTPRHRGVSMKKTYEVELKRTSFIVVTVEAESEEEAEALAFNEAVDNHAYAAWDVESIEEIGGTK